MNTVGLLFLCLKKYHSFRTYGRGEAQFQALLNSELFNERSTYPVALFRVPTGACGPYSRSERDGEANRSGVPRWTPVSQSAAKHWVITPYPNQHVRTKNWTTGTLSQPRKTWLTIVSEPDDIWTANVQGKLLKRQGIYSDCCLAIWTSSTTTITAVRVHNRIGVRLKTAAMMFWLSLTAGGTYSQTEVESTLWKPKLKKKIRQ